jgi:Protein of unknown function (DUF2924)
VARGFCVRPASGALERPARPRHRLSGAAKGAGRFAAGGRATASIADQTRRRAAQAGQGRLGHVREHQGVVHEVLAVPGGFCWQGKTYDSLSNVAKKITGTSWNGPRFFGLRSKRDHQTSDNPDPGGAHSRQVDEEPFKGGRASAKRSGRRSSVRPGPLALGGAR